MNFFKMSIIKQLLLLIMLAGMYINVQAQRIVPISKDKQEKIEQLEELYKMAEQKNELSKAVSALNQITYIYWENGRPDKAIETFNRAIPIYEKQNDLESLHKIYSNIGLIYLDMEDVRNAKQAFVKGVQVKRRMGDKKGISSALVDLSYVLALGKEYQEAITSLEEAMKIALEGNFETLLPSIYNQLASNYTNIGNIKKGEEYRQKYNAIKEYLATQSMKGEYQEREQKNLAEIRKSQAEVRATELEMQLKQLVFEEKQDSITGIVRAKEDSLLQAKRLDSLQKQNILLLEQEAQLKEVELEKQKALQDFQRLIIYSVLGGLALGLILLVVLYRSNKSKQRANKELAEKNNVIEQKGIELQDAFDKIEDQNTRITQSITYAREIQRSLLPPKETLRKYISDSFILFEPLYLVSGDFYWFREIAKDGSLSDVHSHPIKEESRKDRKLINGDKFVIAAVDCTGHGVPGAFMSMIGYNLLDGIIQRGITQSHLILSELHKGVRKALKQDETDNRDGMDAALCVFDISSKTIQFSGANNPVIYIQDGEVQVIKGDRYAIGGSQKEEERSFTPHLIQVDKPTWFYIFSDGYIDQFGGEDQKKFLLKNLKDLLLKIHQLPADEQEKILKETLFAWMKAKENQIDDVLIIGFKIGDYQ